MTNVSYILYMLLYTINKQYKYTKVNFYNSNSFQLLELITDQLDYHYNDTHIKMYACNLHT